MTPSARWLVSGVALLLLGGAFGWLMVDDIPSVMHDASDRPENQVTVWGAETVGQTFRPPAPNLSALEFSFRGPPRKDIAEVIFHLRRSPDDREDLRTVRQTIGRTRRDIRSRFSFEPIATTGEHTFSLLLEYPSGTRAAPLSVRTELPQVGGQAFEWVDYPAGTLLQNGVPADGDLEFTVLARGRKPFATQVAGIALLGGTVLLVMALLAFRHQNAPRALRTGAVLLGIGVPVVFLLPFLTHLTSFGTGDWDMNMTLYAAAEQALNRERAFPAWNPYLCGGTPLAAFPESPVFSPFFATTLLFGPVIGPKLNIVLHLMLGFLGMLLLLRWGWRVSWPAAFLGSSVVFFSSFVGLHLFAGHTRKMAIAWIPWVLYFQQKALAGGARNSLLPRLRFAAPAGAALSLMFLEGSVYLSLYTVVFLALVNAVASLQRRTWRPLVAGLLTIVVGGLLAGVHLVPTAASQSRLAFDLERPATPLPIKNLVDVFLDPNQDPYARKFDGQLLPWLEYGAYVGIVPVLLFGLGAWSSRSRMFPWVVTGVVFLLGSFWEPAQRALEFIPILGNLRNPQRMAVMVTLVVGLGAALGLDRVRHWLTPGPEARAGQPATPDRLLSGPASVALSALVALLIGHLLFVNTETLASIFTLPPGTRPPRHTIDSSRPFRQGWAPNKLLGTDDSFVFTLGNALKNRGSVNRCSVANVQHSLTLRLAPDETSSEAGRDFTHAPYAGEAFVVSGSGTANVVRQETTVTEVAYQAETPARLMLNQNFHPGWLVELRPSGGKPTTVPASAHEGAVSIEVPAGPGTLTFRYRTPFLGLGILTTALGLVTALTLWRIGVQRA